MIRARQFWNFVTIVAVAGIVSYAASTLAVSYVLR
jgi:hypothetical protein